MLQIVSKHIAYHLKVYCNSFRKTWILRKENLNIQSVYKIYMWQEYIKNRTMALFQTAQNLEASNLEASEYIPWKLIKIFVGVEVLSSVSFYLYY